MAEKQETPFHLFYQLQNVFFTIEQLKFLKTKKMQDNMTDDIDAIFKTDTAAKEEIEKQIASVSSKENWIAKTNQAIIPMPQRESKERNTLGATQYMQAITKQNMLMNQYYEKKQPMQWMNGQNRIQKQTTTNPILWMKKADPQERWHDMRRKQNTTKQRDVFIQKHEIMNHERLLELQQGSMNANLTKRIQQKNIQLMQYAQPAHPLRFIENKMYTNTIRTDQAKKDKNGLMYSYGIDKNTMLWQGNESLHSITRQNIQKIAYLEKVKKTNEQKINSINHTTESEIPLQRFQYEAGNVGQKMKTLNRAMIMEENYLDNFDVNKKRLMDANNQDHAGTTTIRMQNDFHIQGNEFLSKTEVNPFELAEKIGRQIADEIETSVSGWYR